MTKEEAKDYIREWCPYDRQEEIIKALEQQPCDDCISRQAAQTKIKNICDEYRLSYEDGERKAATGGSAYALGHAFDDLPSVNPAKKVGRWIKTPKAVMGEGYMWYCEKCEHQVYQDSSRPYPSENYCPNCGAKMAEQQESEEEE